MRVSALDSCLRKDSRTLGTTRIRASLTGPSVKKDPPKYACTESNCQVILYSSSGPRRGGCAAAILISHQFSRKSPNISGLMPAFSDALMISIANALRMGVGTFLPRIDEGIFWIT